MKTSVERSSKKKKQRGKRFCLNEKNEMILVVVYGKKERETNSRKGH